MSELKAFDITVAEEGYCVGIVKYRRAVYDKSEADKVIAELEKDKLELKQRVNVLEGRLFGLSQSHNIETYTCGCLEREISELKNEKKYTIECTTEVVNAQEKEIRRQKYKRCLVMADYCYTNLHCIMGHRLCSFADWKKEWFERWHRRWMELAEKFKETK